MSQKKVDQYKEEKANRKQIIKKEKRIQRLEEIALSLIGILLVVWIGFSVYNTATTKKDVEETVVTTDLNVTALDDFMGTLDAEAE